LLSLDATRLMKTRKTKTKRRTPADPGCPIVGIGASAGGLEAFTQLLKQLPLDTGFGFVLVQHLDPLHDSALTQLLARTTAMPVSEATNNLRVEANRIYIIPPNTSMGIAGGRLKLRPRARNGAAARSIDFFFEALAHDQRERAVGVILSGNASDGTVGLEAIKAEGGLTFAQDESARFESMPRSAVAAGCVDAVLSPAKIARELARIARHPYVAGREPRETTDAPSATGAPESPAKPEPDGYKSILLLLRNHSGVDFSHYKTSTIHRRMTRRAVLNHRDSLESYADFLRGNPKELDTLYADALISVTSFFRNADSFAVLKSKVLVPLLAARGDEPLRVWVLGCSTGQEAYTIAMLFTEAAEKSHRPRQLQVFATDLSEANLNRARQGLYPKSATADISPERLRRFFVQEDGGYRIIKALREQVVFARHNLISDPPFSRMDLITCRNVMIYFEPSLQQKAMPAFHYALKPEGYLFLGASETVGAFTDLFVPVDKRQKIFARKEAPARAFNLPLRSEPTTRPGKLRAASLTGRGPGGAAEAFRGELNAEREADRVTVNQFAPPSVLINADLQILQFRGATGLYLEPPTGKARFDLLKMAREGLMLPLRAAVNRAKKGQQVVRQTSVVFKSEGRSRSVHLEVVPLKNLKEPRYLVLFEDPARLGQPASLPDPGPPAPRLSRREETSRIASLEQDLAETRDYLQSIQEHQEAANEELQASNEEGQSANEELQSLNEELETSKEELESTNEELTTVNEEMVNRNAELNRLNGDLTNLQSSTKLVILLLGRDLTIRRFSSQAEQQFSLHSSDLGRSVGGIRHNLDLPELENIVTQVITTVRECEREVQSRDGHWYSLRVRPYLTVENKVDGAVLVLLDIHEAKQAEQEVIHSRDFAEAVITTVCDPLLIIDAGLQVHKVNEAFLTTFKVTLPEVIGHRLSALDAGLWKSPRLRQHVQKVLPHNVAFDNLEVTHEFKKIGRRTFLLNARMLSQHPGHRDKILLGFLDITERKEREEALREAKIQLARHAGHLETTVTRRTAQLTKANRKLSASLDSVRRSDEKNRLLLAESEVMQRKLRQLTHQILTAQEEERKKISRELHDEVVQTLVGINVELSGLVHGNSPDVKILKDKITHTQRLVESSVDAVHRFARELRPAVLDDLGLIPALLSYCKGLAERKKLKIRLAAFRAVETLESDRRTVLFRVAQEALNNVARHARATRVKLTISRIPGAVRMEISDNGKAFPVRKILRARTKRLGLVGMRERVEMVGGRLTIESTLGKGTTVRAEIPFILEKTKK
jgi:two-component system, chemotaxis family, CheB/CheR fusion protein